MKRKICLIAVFTLVACMLGITNVSAAETHTYNLTRGAKILDIPAHNYRYAKLTFSATAGQTAKFYFIGSNDWLSTAKTLGNSTNVTLKATNRIYILPRSGMGCPSDATYCFGAGLSYSQTMLMTDAYAAYGIYYTGGASSYNFTLTYYD